MSPSELKSFAPFKTNMPPCGVSLPLRRLHNGEATSLSGGWVAVFKKRKTTFSAGARVSARLTPSSVVSLGRGYSDSRVAAPFLVRRRSGWCVSTMLAFPRDLADLAAGRTIQLGLRHGVSCATDLGLHLSS